MKSLAWALEDLDKARELLQKVEQESSYREFMQCINHVIEEFPDGNYEELSEVNRFSGLAKQKLELIKFLAPVAFYQPGAKSKVSPGKTAEEIDTYLIQARGRVESAIEAFAEA